jgi:hypothetical protein
MADTEEKAEIFIDTPDDATWDGDESSNEGDGQLADEKSTDKDGGSTTEPKKEDKPKGEPKAAAGVAKSDKDAGGKTVYTPEEVAELLKTGSNVDTSRLSVEGQLLMKSFQRGYDDKFKALAEEKKKFEPTPQSEAPRAKLFRRYTENPMGVTAEINAEIEKLEGVEPGDQDYQNARRLIAQLHAMKDEFRESRTYISEGQKMKDSIYVKADAAVHAAIPDWETKEPKLTEFALSLGLELDDIKVMTDPTIMGPRSIRFIKTINAVYDKMMAGMTAEKKVDKKAPTQLGRPGSASTTTEVGGEKALDKMSYEEYKAHRMKGLNKN